MLLFPADRAAYIRSVDDAVTVALAGARRAFDLGLDELACHLVARPYTRVGSRHGIFSVISPDGIDLPMPTIQAARAIASSIECDAAIWVVPGHSRADGLTVFVERPDMTEQAFSARPESPRDYVLAGFDAGTPSEMGPDAYVVLPTNVVEYAAQYGLDGDGAFFGPSAIELERARAAPATCVHHASYRERVRR